MLVVWEGMNFMDSRQEKETIKQVRTVELSDEMLKKVVGGCGEHRTDRWQHGHDRGRDWQHGHEGHNRDWRHHR
jgi:hypothetical protein